MKTKEKINDYPVIRHPFCQNNRCKICLEDSLLLEDFLGEKLNDENKHDWLGEYRQWLDNIYKFPEAETEWGWFHPDVFRPDIIDKFIDYINSEKPINNPMKNLTKWEKDLIKKHKLELLFYAGNQKDEIESLLKDIRDYVALQKQEILEETEHFIRSKLGLDAGYMGHEAWDWDLDNLPEFEDFIDQLKQTLKK